MLIYLPGSAYLIHHLWRQNDMMTQQTEGMEGTVAHLKSELTKSKNRLAAVEYQRGREGRSLEPQPQPQPQPQPEPEPEPERQPERQPEPQAQEKAVTARAEEEAPPEEKPTSPPVKASVETISERPKVVDVRDMVIRRDGARMNIRFDLVNIQEGHNRVGGYVHIIARDYSADPPRLWVYPQEDLRDGVPVNYRKGQLFYINRYKPIKGKFHLNSQDRAPSSIFVLVYDQSGKTIFEKEFEVKNAS
jgi:hypothetical protein